MEQALVQNGAALMYYRVGSFIKEKFLYITKRLVVLNLGKLNKSGKQLHATFKQLSDNMLQIFAPVICQNRFYPPLCNKQVANIL